MPDNGSLNFLIWTSAVYGRKPVSDPLRRNSTTCLKRPVIFSERNGHFVKSGPKRRATTKFKPIAKAFATTFAFAIATYAAVMGLTHAYQHDWKIILYLVGCTAISWFHFSQLNTKHDSLADLSCAVCLSSFTLLIAWALPALIIFLSLTPQSHRRGIQVFVLVLSVGLSIAYYTRHVDWFPSRADTLAYFSAVGLGLVTAISIT